MIVKNHIIPSLPLRTKESCIPVEGLRKDSLHDICYTTSTSASYR